jgi:hypothetical protein
MPFESQAQRAYMHIHHPEIADRWEQHTPPGKLPQHAAKADDTGDGMMYPSGMSPQERMAAAVKKAKDAIEEYEKAYADVAKGGMTPAAPPVAGSGVGPTSPAMNPSGTHAGPSGPALASQAGVGPTKKLSPEDPSGQSMESFSGQPPNPVRGAASFSAATPGVIDNSPQAAGVRKGVVDTTPVSPSFFKKSTGPSFIEKSYRQGNVVIDPETPRTNLLQSRTRGQQHGTFDRTRARSSPARLSEGRPHGALAPSGPAGSFSPRGSSNRTSAATGSGVVGQSARGGGVRSAPRHGSGGP